MTKRVQLARNRSCWGRICEFCLTTSPSSSNNYEFGKENKRVVTESRRGAGVYLRWDRIVTIKLSGRRLGRRSTSPQNLQQGASIQYHLRTYFLLRSVRLETVKNYSHIKIIKFLQISFEYEINW